MHPYLLSVDIEGASGISTVAFCTEDGEYADLGRRYLHHDVNAVVEGILAADPDADIIVRDAHGSANNLNLEMLHPQARLLSGWGTLLDMVAPLDPSFRGLFLVGYHAGGHDLRACIAHTFSRSIAAITLNGTRYNEAGVNALVAGMHHVPVGFVSGDVATCHETGALLPGVETVAVKESLARTAVLAWPLRETRERLFNGARRATEALLRKACPPCRLAPGTVCEFVLYERGIAESVFATLHALLRHDPAYDFDEARASVRFTPADIRDFVARFHLITNLCYYASRGT